MEGTIVSDDDDVVSTVLQDPKLILQLADELRDPNVSVRLCDIDKRFTPFTFLSHSTASASRVAFTTVLSTAQPVAVKMFFGSVEPSLLYEARVYRDIVSPIIRNKQCPCFVEFVAFATCEIPSLRNLPEIQKLMKRARFKAGQDPGALNMLVTLRAPVISGEEAFDSNQVHPPLLMLQMLFATVAMLRNQLYHYDLHTKNWLWQQPGYTKPTIFALSPTVIFVIPAGSPKLLLFDWDVAYATKLGENHRLRPNSVMCQQLQVCNNPSPEVTVYKTFCALYQKPGMDTLQDTFRLIYSELPELESSDKQQQCYSKTSRKRTVGDQLHTVLEQSTDLITYRLTMAHQIPEQYDLYVMDPTEREQVETLLQSQSAAAVRPPRPPQLPRTSVKEPAPTIPRAERQQLKGRAARQKRIERLRSL